MGISKLTGLPELPEGQFWRVAETQGHSWGGLSLGLSNIAYVALMTKMTVTSTRPRIIHLPFGLEFVWGSESVTETTDHEILREDIVIEEAYFQNVYANEDDETPIGVRETTRVTRMSGDNVTPEAIVEACEKLLLRKKELEKAHELLGDYPPKSLPAA